MKKLFSTLCMALIAAAMIGQEPVITFSKTEHDFGKIQEENGRVSTVFEFKNEGMTPLVLSNVRASCGCTTPTWTREPVEPGQTGSITVTYNPNGRPGRFQKTITITSNATEATKKVIIKGEVIPKAAKPENQYKVAVGDLSLKTRVLDLGIIKTGETHSGELEYANLTEAEHSVDLYVAPADNYLINQTTLTAVKPNETGKFFFAIDTRISKIYGPVDAYAYVIVDGKKDLSEAFRLEIKANIVEDFSNLSIEEKQQAPIIETAAEQNAGKIAAGKTLKYALPVKNSGMNPLEIRRAYSTDSHLTIRNPKAIKSGKKGNIQVEINTTGLEAGAYSREMVIITNDYANPIKKIRIHFDVE